MKKLIVCMVLVIGAIGSRAEESHFFQASLTPDIAIYPETTQINGIALDIWGQNPQHSLNLGFINGSTGNSSGFAWGLVNYSETYTGVSWAFVNVNKTSFHGWQSGWVNVSQDEFIGFQSGWILNYAKEMRGLQLGLVNYAQELRGVQIGLANIAINNTWFDEFPDKLAPGFPIVNWSF
jgi:hypothetical protein